MTRAEAVEYFMVYAVVAGINEGMSLAEDDEGEDSCALHTRYEDCIRWLLGLPRSYQPEFVRW